MRTTSSRPSSRWACGREAHPSTVDARVRGGDAPALERPCASPSISTSKRRRLPARRARAARRRGRRAGPSRGGASLAIRLASESKPSDRDAEERARRPPRRCRSARGAPSASTSQAATGVERDAGHAREVVAAAAGQDAEDRVRACRAARPRPRRPARRPTASPGSRRAPAASRASSQPWSRLCVRWTVNGSPSSRSARLDARQQAQRAAAGGVRVDEQGERGASGGGYAPRTSSGEARGDVGRRPGRRRAPRRRSSRR